MAGGSPCETPLLSEPQPQPQSQSQSQPQSQLPLQLQLRLSDDAIDAIEGCGIVPSVKDVDVRYVCVICTQACFGGVQTSCCHQPLHRRCLQRWRATAVRFTCPLCRKDLTKVAEPCEPFSCGLRSAISALPVTCPQNCGEETRWEDLEAHVRFDCPRTRLLCECSSLLLRCNVEEHRRRACPQTSVTCEHCGQQLKRGDLRRHWQGQCTAAEAEAEAACVHAAGAGQPKAEGKGKEVKGKEAPLRKEQEARQWAARWGADFEEGVLVSLCSPNPNPNPNPSTSKQPEPEDVDVDVDMAMRDAGHYNIVMTTRPLGIALEHDEARDLWKISEVYEGGQAEYLGIAPGHFLLAVNDASFPTGPDVKSAEEALAQVFQRKSRHLRPVYSEKQRCHKVRGNDKGRDAWYYVLVNSESMDEFQRQLAAKTMMNLRELGEILESGYGSSPPETVKRRIHHRFGMPLEDDM